MRSLAALVALAALALAACHGDEFKRYPLKIYMTGEGALEMGPNDTLLLQPKIVYNDNATYQWTDQEGNLISTEQDLLFIPSRMADYHFTFRAQNDLGSDTIGVTVAVLLNANGDEFTNFKTLKRKSGLYMLPDTLPGAWRGEWADFANVCNADTSAWSAFAFCSKTGVQNLINEAARGTSYTPNATKANNYFAVNASAGDARVTFNRPYSPVSIDVANENQVYLASKFGYELVQIVEADTVTTVYEPARKDDYYRLRVYALGEGLTPTGASVAYDLIECGYDNPAKYFRLSEWHHLDLAPLGRCSGLLLDIETSLPEALPRQFCVDNLKVQD